MGPGQDALAQPWLLAAESERRGVEVVFKAELIGRAARMDTGGELVTLSFWVNDERSVCWERSRNGRGWEEEESAVAPLTFKCL